MAARKNTGRKKPPGQALGHRKDNVIELVPDMKPAPDIPIESPEPEVTQWWNEFWASPVSTAVDDSDLDTLRRLATYKNDWQRVRRVIDSDTEHGGYVTRGSTGQYVESPHVKQLHKLEALIAGIENQFGGGPLSRLRLGMEMTNAVKSQNELAEIMGGGRSADESAAEEIDLENFAKS